MFTKRKENKEKFLSQYKGQSKIVYERVIKAGEKYEDIFNKEMEFFNNKEVSTFVEKELKPKTLISARTSLSIVSEFFDYSVENGYIDCNNLREETESIASSFKYSKLYFSKFELEAITDNIINYQDSIIITLLFNGLGGKDFSDLTELKITHINEENNTININDKTFHVDEDTIFQAKMANSERFYSKRNGESEYNNPNDTAILGVSEYIIRATLTNAKKNNELDLVKDVEVDSVSKWTVYNRLESLRNLPIFEEYKDCFVSKNIQRSGMIYCLYQLKENGYDITSKDTLEIVCKKYNVKYTWQMRDFLNEDVLNSLYN